MLFSVNAKADCPTTGLPARFAFTVAASNTLAVGEVIPGTTRTLQLSGQCSETRTFGLEIVACPAATPPIQGTAGIYPTGMAGVGMRLRNSSGTSLTGTNNCASPDSVLGRVGQDGRFNVSATFELVKTGPISGGTLNNATAFSTGVLNTGILLNNGNTVAHASLITAENTTVRSVACSVTTGSATQTIALPRISAQALPDSGSVAGRTQFQIDLNCQAGVNVRILFEPSPAAPGTGSVLASTGTANGVGVQLLNANATPIPLNTPTQLTTSTTGNMSFRFHAEYRRLSTAAVTAGTVSARTVFTMHYQ